MNDNPYRQVAMSYVHRIRSLASPVFFILGGISIFLILLVGFFVSKAEGFVFPFFIEIGLCCALAVYIREQFSYPQASLIPNYCRVHIRVAAVAAVLIAVVLPTIFTLAAGWRSLGFISAIVLLFGVILWLAQFRLTWLISWIWLIGLIRMGPSRRTIADIMASGQFEIFAVAFLGVGIALSLAAGYRLMHLDPEKQIPIRKPPKDGAVIGQTPDQDDTDNSFFQRTIRLWASDRQTTALIGHVRRAPASRWSSVCRWQAGMPTFLSTMLQCFTYLMLWLLMTWLGKMESSGILPMLAIFAVVMPMCGWVSANYRQASAKSYELLLPVDRTNYIKQQGMAAALSQFQIWAAMNAIILLWWMIAAPKELPAAAMISILVVSALFQVWLYGIAVLLTLPPRGELDMSRAVVGLFGLVPLFATWAIARPATEWQWGSFAIASFFAAFGLVIAWAAYRRWLVADFG